MNRFRLAYISGFLTAKLPIFTIFPKGHILQFQFPDELTTPMNLLGFSLAIVIGLFFFLRERAEKSRYRRIRNELHEREEMIIVQESKIRAQREEIEQQITNSDKQNSMIHLQAIELEKNRYQLEKIVESRTRELKVAKEKAEESDHLKTAFLENMSHEIRTPMNAIMGFANLLNDRELNDDDKAKFIARINHNCHVLLRLIEDILDISKIQESQLEMHKSRFSVEKALQNLFDLFYREKQELGLSDIELILDNNNPEKEYFIYSDAFRFSQIFNKLINNAFKYTEKGEIRIGYNLIYNSEYEKEPSYLQFYVNDTGIGIPTEKSEFIFNRFSKIEDNVSKLYRGAGLGLFISKKLVNLMGGNIWVQSKMNEGSTFYFTLPYFETEDFKQKQVTTKPKLKIDSIKNYDWRKKIILIVEDEKNNFIYLNEIIKRTGAAILEAKNGQQAIDAVKENSKISLILMDILMPELDGYEATREIKEIRPSLPIIAQTAYTMNRQKEKCLEIGCDGYISKPYEPGDLLELISNFI